jgi:hypothetical protein
MIGSAASPARASACSSFPLAVAADVDCRRQDASLRKYIDALHKAELVQVLCSSVVQCVVY